MLLSQQQGRTYFTHYAFNKENINLKYIYYTMYSIYDVLFKLNNSCHKCNIPAIATSLPASHGGHD